MPKVGKQTWRFDTNPRVYQRATVAGKVESEGPLGSLYDVSHDDDRNGMDSWEHAEQSLLSQAVETVLIKSRLEPGAIDLMIGADLNAQLSSFYFGLRSYPIPSLGVYSACASICESLAIAALAIDSGCAERVLVGTSSHNSTAERQFRYPTEYGAQKPPSAQRTVTGAGAAILTNGATGIAVTHATVGQVVDLGIKSPWEMGAAMAPAAASTLETHLSDVGRTLADYDCIATGDLGVIGHNILVELLAERGMRADERLTDCGILIYDKDQPEVFSGGSGGACCTLVTFAHLLRKVETGEYERLLVLATGALLSTVTAQQQDTIPGISHAIAFERKD